MSPFDFINTINSTKTDLLTEDPLLEKDYVPYVINRQMSYFYDTVLFSNEMNRCHGVPNKWQYDFYLHGIRKGKRFAKWSKPPVKTSDLELVMMAYNYSKTKAETALNILSEEQLKQIRKMYETGGR
jgi:hypothetical protein